MRTDNFDKIAKEENILDRVERAERRGRSVVRRNVRSNRLSNIANEMGEVDYRAVDADGNLRMVMSAYDLFDELAVHAHLAGLDTNQDVTFYISADDGKAYFANGSGYFDLTGLHMSAEVYPSSAYIDWLADDDGSLIGQVVGTYGGALTNSGVLIYGQAHDSGVEGLVHLGANNESGDTKTTFTIDTRGLAVLDLDQGTNTTKGSKSLTIRSLSAETDELDTLLYIQAKSSGTVANGFGPAVAFGIEDSAGNVDTAGYMGVYWTDKTHGSEDAAFKIGLLKTAGGPTLVDALIIDPTAGVTIPFGTTISAGGINVTGNITANNFVNIPSAGDLTIASGVVTATGSRHRVDTQAAAATDDLDTINGGTAGDILILSTVNGARDVTAKDGTGNLLLAGDFVMDTASDTLTLYRLNSTNWVELARSNNA